MNILTFLYTLLVSYWSDALVVITFVAVLGILYKKGRKDLVKRIIKNLVVKAEKELGSATGTAKYNLVIATIYEKLPILLRLCFSKAEINDYIEDAVTWLKKRLEDPNVNLLSYEQELNIGILSSGVEITPESSAEVPNPIIIQPIKKYFDENGIELTQVAPITPIV